MALALTCRIVIFHALATSNPRATLGTTASSPRGALLKPPTTVNLIRFSVMDVVTHSLKGFGHSRPVTKVEFGALHTLLLPEKELTTVKAHGTSAIMG